MGFSKVISFFMVAFAVCQGISGEGLSPKAEEAVKKLIDYVLELPAAAGSGSVSVNGSLSAVPNSLLNANEFWSDKLIQAANQAYQVTAFTLPEFKSRAANLKVMVDRIDSQNKLKLGDAKTLFDVAAMPIRTAIEIVATLKKVPVERFEVDKIKELVQNGLAVLEKVKPELTSNISAVLLEVSTQLAKVTRDLIEFTPETLRRKCYPNVVCVANLLSDLKESVQGAASVIGRGEKAISKTSINVEITTDIKIREEEEKIIRLAKEWAEITLKAYSIDRKLISEYYLSIIIQYNPVSSVSGVVNQARAKIQELVYFIETQRNLSRNDIYSNGYPVIDAWNTVYYLIRNKDGQVLGNEKNEVYVMLDKIYNETVRQVPDFTDEINAFYEELKNINLTATVTTTQVLEQEINETFVGDLVDYYLLYANKLYQPAPQPLKEAEERLNALAKKVEERIPGILAAFNRLRASIEVKVRKLHVEVLYDIANRLYKGGNISHADIYWFGSLNLNSTFRTWKPLILAGDTALEKTYAAILAQNYGSLSIDAELSKIVESVLQVLAQYEDIFGAELVKKRSATVVQQLFELPSAEFNSFLKNALENITSIYGAKIDQVKAVDILEADRIAFLKRGVQTFPNAIAPKVEQSYYHNVKVYRSKLALQDILLSLQNTTAQLVLNEIAIKAAGPAILERIGRIAKEYIAILHNYASLKSKGTAFLADLPSITVIAYRILREVYGLQVDDVPDFTEDIVRNDFTLVL